jgi:hypothetical protein
VKHSEAAAHQARWRRRPPLQHCGQVLVRAGRSRIEQAACLECLMHSSLQLKLITALSAAALFSLAACSRKEGLPAGVNYVPSGDSTIVLNRHADAWKLFIAGADVTSGSQLSVSVGEAETYYDVELKGDSAPATVPKRFRLELGLDGVIRCQATPSCPATLEIWKRTEVPGR